MNGKKVLFLEAANGGGHISITTAIIQALQKKAPGVQSIRYDFIPPFVHKFYQVVSRQFVNAHLFFYKATDKQQGEIFTAGLSRIVSRKKLTKKILESNPDLIFSNYWLAINEIPNILKKFGKNIPFIVFAPDPFSIHSGCLSKRANITLVATLAAYQSALQGNIAPERLGITGHPVRQEFTET